LTIQILHYEFLGPIKISEWGPPMDEVVYVLFGKIKEGFNMIYADQSEKVTESNFFINNDKFKCWLQQAGSEDSLYLSIYPLWDSEKTDRERIVQKIISKYKPVCNTE